MDTGDIIVFRNKKFITSLYSAFMFDLDNHVGIIIKINNKDYLCDFGPTSFKHIILNMLFFKQYKTGKANMTPFEHFKNKEYYHYKFNQKVDISQNRILDIFNESKKLNFCSNIWTSLKFLYSNPFQFCFITYKDNQFICLSYVFWFLDKLGIYDMKYIDRDLTKLYATYTLPNRPTGTTDLFRLVAATREHTYKLVAGHNVGKKDLSAFNPYKYAYYLSTIIDIVTPFCINIKNNNNESITYQMVITALIISTSGVIASAYSNKSISGKINQGKRFLGVPMVMVALNIFLLEQVLNINKHHLWNIELFFTRYRIFLTRYASWLCNDLTGQINKKTLRPYDTAWYEAIFEGLIPFLFMFLPMDIQTQNIIVIFSYSICRWIIENYKHKYIKNNNLSLGQIDTIVFSVIAYWYTFSSNKFEYMLLYLFYQDVNYRIVINKFNSITNISKNIKLYWRHTYNRGFYNGRMKERGKYFKLIYPSITLFFYNKYLLKNWCNLYIFNTFALLNIFERFINGHVTDYLTIQFYTFKTFNLNFADIIVTLYTVLSLVFTVCGFYS